MYRYRNSEIRDLAEQQARFATRSVRVRQLDNAEQLLLELGHAETHQFAEICHRITGYRPDSNGASAPISASDLAHDLRCLVEELSGTLEFPEEQAGEPVYSLEDVSERLGVSVRTIARWRTHGLPSRWYVRDGRKRLGVRHSSLEQFIARHQEVVERGRSFRQLTDQEREGVLLEARRLAHQGLGLTEVSRQVASTFGRAKETIRYTIRTFDSEHPEIAIFPATRSPMTADEKQLAYDLLQKGIRLAELCRRFRQPRRVVEAGVKEVRAGILHQTTLDFIDSEEFHLPDAESRIVTELPVADGPTSSSVPPGLPAYVAELYRVPLLTKSQEQHYFRLMNYLKFRFGELQKQMNPRSSSLSVLRQLESLLVRIADIRNLLIRSNLRLVVSIARRHIRPGMNFFDLVSDGNMSLIRAVEKFDYSRGNKFSTYATWAIMKNFARSVPAEHKQLDRFRTGREEVFLGTPEDRGSGLAEERVNRAQRSAILELMNELTGREQTVIACRFGLETNTEPETLEQVGVRLGVTKERIRQIERRTLEKLRRIAERRSVDIPGI